MSAPAAAPAPDVDPVPAERARRARPQIDLIGYLADRPAPPPAVGHPLLAASTVLATGSVVDAIDPTEPWWMLAGGGGAAVVSGLVVKNRFFDGNAEAWFTALSASAVAGWLAWVAHDSPWSAQSIGMLVLGTTTLGPVYGLLRWRRDKANAKEVQARAAYRAEQKRHTWTQILEEAGAKDITIGEEEPFRAGFTLPLTLGPKAPDFKSLAGLAADIERIAANVTGLPIRAGSIEFERGALAHQAFMIVPTRDVLAETIAFPDLQGPRSIHDPLPIGRFTRGEEIEVNFRSVHGMFSGMNDAGKSGLLNVHTVLLTMCPDNVTFYIAGNKAVRGLAPWLLPWLRGEIDPSTGKPVDRPPFDWVAGDWHEAMTMLLNAYRAVDGRQAMFADGADKWIPSADDPQITILIDESPDLFADNRTLKTHKGEKVTFSELVLKLVRLARSEAIQIIFLTQRGTATMIGPDGGDLKSQIVYRVGFRAMGNMTDVNAVFSTETYGIELATLPNGAFYIEQKGYTRPRVGKAYWLEPARIKQYAIANAQFCGAVDKRTADLMPDYEERWTRPGQRELLDLIAGRRSPAAAGARRQQGVDPDDWDTWTADGEGEVSSVLDDWEAEMEAMMPQVPQDLLDRAEAADKARAAAAQAKAEALDRLDEAQSSLEAEMAALEASMNLPPATDDVRNAKPPAPPKALDDDVLALLGAIVSANLLSTDADPDWIPAADILAVAATTLNWPNNTEGARRVSRALGTVDVFSSRPTIGGKKITSYPKGALRNVIEEYRA
ncbi:hypothetical protein SUDANB95_07957 (plasmid) [Actinosynnema sp. ALI-1.44]